MMNNKELNLEEKDIYKLFNQIKLEESEFNAVDEEAHTIQKERIKKNLKKKIKIKNNLKILKYSSAAAAVGLACLIGIGTAYPAFAENIPILSSISQILNDKFGFHGDYTKYSQVVNKSVTDKGITVTINEALADDSKLILGYTIKSNKKIEGLEVVGLSRFLKINGKTFGSTGSGTGNYIDDYTYVGSDEIHTTLPKNSDRFNVDLNVTDIMGIKGKWNFAFSVSKDGLSKQSTVFKPNNKLDFPDSNVTIDKVVFSPIDTAIFVSGNYKDKNRKQDGHTFDYDNWIAFDDKGIELIPKGGGGTSDSHKQTFQSEMDFVNMKNTPKYLTIIPCKITPSAGGGVSVDENGKETPITLETQKPEEISKIIDGVYPIVLPQGKFGKLIINEINTENNTTTVKFTAEGKAPYFQAADLLIKDDKGEVVKVKHYTIREDEQKPNEFTKVFEGLNPNKKYTIFTNDFSNVELREDLKFNIQLNK